MVACSGSDEKSRSDATNRPAGHGPHHVANHGRDHDPSERHGQPQGDGCWVAKQTPHGRHHPALVRYSAQIEAGDKQGPTPEGEYWGPGYSAAG